MRTFSRFLLAAVTLAAGVVHAASDATTFKVKLVITESCKISTVAPKDVDFGSIARASAVSNYDATGQLTVNCSPGTPYAIGLSGGANTAGSAAAPASGDRRMKHATLTLYVPYELYSNSARTTFWGNTAGSTVTGTGTGEDVALPVYGRLTNVNFAAGTYEDTVTATVTY